MVLTRSQQATLQFGQPFSLEQRPEQPAEPTTGQPFSLEQCYAQHGVAPLPPGSMVFGAVPTPDAPPAGLVFGRPFSLE